MGMRVKGKKQKVGKAIRQEGFNTSDQPISNAIDSIDRKEDNSVEPEESDILYRLADKENKNKEENNNMGNKTTDENAGLEPMVNGSIETGNGSLETEENGSSVEADQNDSINSRENISIQMDGTTANQQTDNQSDNRPSENNSKKEKLVGGLQGTYNKITTLFHINSSADANKTIPDRSDIKRNIVLPLIYFTGVLLYLELVLHLIQYKSMDGKIIFPIVFTLPIGCLLTFLSGIFHKLVNKLLFWLFTGFICLIFSVQLIYFYVFKVYFSFQSMGMAGDAFSEFGSDIATAMKENILGLTLIFLPLAALAVLMKLFFDCKRRSIKEQGILLSGSVFLHIVTLLLLMIFGKGDYTPYDLYHNTRVQDLCGKQLGILTMTRLDITNLMDKESKLVLADTDIIDWEITETPTMVPTVIPEATAAPEPKEPDASPTPTPLPTPTPIDKSPNVMDIDFNALAEEEKDKTIKTLHQYFASVAPTNKNEYTGMFEGYNLILITAEGFSPYAIHPEKTPTLHKLVNEGFVFQNFYTALWQTSTSDGEYVPLTGLIPVGSRSMYHARNNLWPFSLAHQFNQLGLNSRAYHNHTYTYYQRDETHPNLGYDYKGVGNGLELPHNVWPNSDLEMIDATVDEYIGEEQFHVYYLTVSGHMNYTFVGNSMSYKNKEFVEDLPYSSDCQAYVACQVELDKALEQLINKLEEAGVADKTVIALSADHYPYGWEKEKLDEIAGHTVDPNFEVYRNHFILWNPAMEENIVVEEPCSSMDILPTLSNLFGLEYDSRLMMGRDIFSEANPLVILSNRSFITDKVMYNAETGDATLLTEEELPEDYISNLNKIIKNKFSVSQSIVKSDYYLYVFPDYEK
jgi:phosphoglycerol transferase MdoB-like AlkP superfamily enzyme